MRTGAADFDDSLQQTLHHRTAVRLIIFIVPRIITLVSPHLLKCAQDKYMYTDGSLPPSLPTTCPRHW